MFRSLKSCFLALCVAAAIVLIAALVVLYLRDESPAELIDAAEHWVGRADSAVRDVIEEIPAIPARETGEAPAAEVVQGDIEIHFTGPSPRDLRMSDRLVELITSAEKSILCAWYDVGFEPAAAALVDRHEEGVQVAIVTDTDYADREALAMCRDAGIPIVLDDRSAFMHNKFCVIDGTTVWTGSTNITTNGFYHNNNNTLLIPSAALAENYTVEFNEMFENQEFGARSPAGTPNEIIEIGDVLIENYFAPEDPVQNRIVTIVSRAEESVDFMAFSFTADPIGDAIEDRIERGVRVRGLFEDRNAHSEYSEDDALAKAGALIVLDTNPRAMHHKVMIIDNETVITGSYNFSKSAAESNDENVVVLHSDWIADAYTREFERIAGIAR